MRIRKFAKLDRIFYQLLSLIPLLVVAFYNTRTWRLYHFRLISEASLPRVLSSSTEIRTISLGSTCTYLTGLGAHSLHVHGWVLSRSAPPRRTPPFDLLLPPNRYARWWPHAVVFHRTNDANLTLMLTKVFLGLLNVPKKGKLWLESQTTGVLREGA